MAEHDRSNNACPTSEDLILAWRGQLPRERREAITRHLQDCADCEARLWELAETVPLSNTEAREVADSCAELLTRLRVDMPMPAQPAPVRRWRRLAAAVLVLALLSGGALAQPGVREFVKQSVDRLLVATGWRKPADVPRRAPAVLTPAPAPGPATSPIPSSSAADADRRAPDDLDRLFHLAVRNETNGQAFDIPDPGLRRWVERNFKDRPDEGARFVPDLLRFLAGVDARLDALHTLSHRYSSTKEEQLSAATRASLRRLVNVHHDRLRADLDELRLRLLVLVGLQLRCGTRTDVPTDWRTRADDGRTLVKTLDVRLRALLTHEDLPPDAAQATAETFDHLWDRVQCARAPGTAPE